VRTKGFGRLPPFLAGVREGNIGEVRVPSLGSCWSAREASGIREMSRFMFIQWNFFFQASHCNILFFLIFNKIIFRKKPKLRTPKIFNKSTTKKSNKKGHSKIKKLNNID